MAMELRKLDEEIQKNMCARPEAKDVAAYWAEFVELWPELTDEEKLEMIGHLVKRIEVRQKNSISLELAPMGGKCCSSVERKFLTTSKWERGRSVLLTTLSLLRGCALSARLFGPPPCGRSARQFRGFVAYTRRNWRTR